MFSTPIALFLLLVPSTVSLPNANHKGHDPPPEICPENWQFDLTSFSGPGCPDSSPTFNRTGTGYSRTTPDWGSHYVPGCAQQWAWFSFPWLQGYISQPSGDVYLSGQRRNSTWCELRIKYREMKGTFAPHDVPKGQEEYKLVMHGNGTTVEANYGLDEGVKAVWKFTYLPVGTSTRPKIMDAIVINGPVWNDTKPARRLEWSPVNETTPRWTEPTCGPTILSIRIDLELKSENSNAKGAIESKQSIFSGDWFGPTQIQ
ncbi:hypothetical protein CC86DRAFT_401067 [Ophiobolus disseminans]|uniref:Uncharacterized protein n=1 Tax=Ophiobolus disseminans TaxID=1469910 RepID=A0A6A7AHZ2_9PLEO|nr:hypothetical protein CC86DRAFT_401067 [Ophiobolus disseminans]